MALLDGKVAIVTGAGQGIGRAHALAFAAAGARVVVNDVGCDVDGRNPGQNAGADEVCAEIAKSGGQAVPAYGSVASSAGAQDIVWAALNNFGRVDILINNAGIARDRTLLSLTEDDLDALLDVNLKGTFFMTQAVGRVLKTQGTGGTIVNTLARCGLIGNFGQTALAAASGGVYGTTLSWALELQALQVNVNAIAPMAVTRMSEALPSLRDATPKTYGPQHIPPLAIFLASEAGRTTTGKVFRIEGTRIFEHQMKWGEPPQKKTPWSVAEIQERISEILR